MTTKEVTPARRLATADREGDLAAIMDLYGGLMRRRLAAGPPILDAAITMAQAKALFLVEASAELHMSALARGLGVSLSTVSGLVDRLVDQGLVTRRDDPADRRQVVVAPTAEGAAMVDRFRQLGVGELRVLLTDLADEELRHVRLAFEALDRAVERAAGRRS